MQFQSGCPCKWSWPCCKWRDVPWSKYASPASICTVKFKDRDIQRKSYETLISSFSIIFIWFLLRRVPICSYSSSFFSIFPCLARIDVFRLTRDKCVEGIVHLRQQNLKSPSSRQTSLLNRISLDWLDWRISLKSLMPWRGPHQWHSNIQASLPSNSSVHLQEIKCHPYQDTVSIDTVTWKSMLKEWWRRCILSDIVQNKLNMSEPWGT